jgi:hypothetical protein
LRHGGGMVVDMPQRKPSQSRRQRIRLVVVGNAQCALELDRQLRIGMNLGKRKLKLILPQFNHVWPLSFQK